ncbi:MAG: SDR family oxidoreductase [Caldilineaceae bacterium]|nr:SDR family oxidoreductase [Caldilineaceae bacterium]
MKIAVFGATGGVGRAFTQQALAAGHTVTALVRDPARMDIEDAGLALVVGNVLDADAVAQTVTGADAVLCTLGNTPNNPDLVVSKGTAEIVKAMEAQGVRRLVVISSLGVGDSKDQVPFAFKMLMKTVLRKAMQDKEAQEDLVRATDLDWTIIRPGGLNNDAASGDYTVGLDHSITAGMVSRADVAAFALQETLSPQYVGQTPAIT